MFVADFGFQVGWVVGLIGEVYMTESLSECGWVLTRKFKMMKVFYLLDKDLSTSSIFQYPFHHHI